MADGAQTDELRLELDLLKIENECRRDILEEEESDFKMLVSGGWKLISSNNVDSFLEETNQKDLDNVLFHKADQFIEFSGDDSVSLYMKIGSKKYRLREMKLSRAHFDAKGGQITFICDDVLKTVFLPHGEKADDTEERYLNLNYLHIANRKNGVECLRVYERIGRTLQDKQKEREEADKLRADNENLKKKLEICKQNSVERLKERMDVLEKDMKILRKANPGLQKLVGKWVNIREPNCFRSLKIKGNTFSKLRENEMIYTVYEENIKHPNGLTMFFEDDRVIEKVFDLLWIWEVKDDLLHITRTNKNRDPEFSSVYVKVGDPI